MVVARLSGSLLSSTESDTEREKERDCLQRITFSEIIHLEGKAYVEWAYGFKKVAGTQNMRSVYWLCLLFVKV